MSKVLITGASGLLGRAVLRRLKDKKEYDVYAVTTKASRLSEYTYVNVVVCDLTSEDERRKLIEDVRPDIMIHLAWDQSDANFRMSLSNMRWLEISKSLLWIFEQNGGKKLLFAGSSSEYDGTSGIMNENVDEIPKSLYGLCKKTFNEYGRKYCKEHNIEYVGMRLFTIYGAEDEHNFGAIPSAFAKLRNDEKIECNSPQTTRDYIYSEDAANVVVQLMEGSYQGIVNVASGQGRSMKEVFECIGKAMNKETLITMNEHSGEGTRFEADISLLKGIGVTGYCSDFEMRINEINSYTPVHEKQ